MDEETISKAAAKVLERLKSEGVFDDFRKRIGCTIEDDEKFVYLKEKVGRFVEASLNSLTWPCKRSQIELQNQLRSELTSSSILRDVNPLVANILSSSMDSLVAPEIHSIVGDVLHNMYLSQEDLDEAEQEMARLQAEEEAEEAERKKLEEAEERQKAEEADRKKAEQAEKKQSEDAEKAEMVDEERLNDEVDGSVARKSNPTSTGGKISRSASSEPPSAECAVTSEPGQTAVSAPPSPTRLRSTAAAMSPVAATTPAAVSSSADSVSVLQDGVLTAIPNVVLFPPLVATNFEEPAPTKTAASVTTGSNTTESGADPGVADSTSSRSAASRQPNVTSPMDDSSKPVSSLVTPPSPPPLSIATKAVTVLASGIPGEDNSRASVPPALSADLAAPAPPGPSAAPERHHFPPIDAESSHFTLAAPPPPPKATAVASVGESSACMHIDSGASSTSLPGAESSADRGARAPGHHAIAQHASPPTCPWQPLGETDTCKDNKAGDDDNKRSPPQPPPPPPPKTATPVTQPSPSQPKPLSSPQAPQANSPVSPIPPAVTSSPTARSPPRSASPPPPLSAAPCPAGEDDAKHPALAPATAKPGSKVQAAPRRTVPVVSLQKITSPDTAARLAGVAALASGHADSSQGVASADAAATDTASADVARSGSAVDDEYALAVDPLVSEQPCDTQPSSAAAEQQKAESKSPANPAYVSSANVVVDENVTSPVDIMLSDQGDGGSGVCDETLSVSSVHTSDLSSFDSRISSESDSPSPSAPCSPAPPPPVFTATKRSSCSRSRSASSRKISSSTSPDRTADRSPSPSTPSPKRRRRRQGRSRRPVNKPPAAPATTPAPACDDVGVAKEKEDDGVAMSRRDDAHGSPSLVVPSPVASRKSRRSSRPTRRYSPSERRQSSVTAAAPPPAAAVTAAATPVIDEVRVRAVAAAKTTTIAGLAGVRAATTIDDNSPSSSEPGTPQSTSARSRRQARATPVAAAAARLGSERRRRHSSSSSASVAKRTRRSATAGMTGAGTGDGTASDMDVTSPVKESAVRTSARLKSSTRH